MATRAQLEAIAREEAARARVPWRLAAAMVNAESAWRPDAGSPAGARGLTQLMPATARSLGVTNILDPRQNLRGGFTYLRRQLDAFGGDPRKALAAYNAGPGAVSKYGGIPPYRETQNYVAKIMSSLGGQVGAVEPQASAAGAAAAAAPAAGGASPMELISALRQMRGYQPIRARGFDAQAGATRLAGIQMLRSAAAAPAATQSATLNSSAPVDMGDGSFAHPTGGKGAVIGRPHQGTHSLGNWQSDNAIDFGVPVGAPIYATSDGVIGPNFGSLGSNSGSRFAGYRLTLDAPGNAPDWWYGHLSRYAPGIKPGAQVRRGQLLGYGGSANNVPHLHIGVSRGNPLELLGIR